jgi:intein-encoded DNA endonuclease-like protein
MGKRGPQPKGKVKIKWSANFAYAIGLLATDGCLYKDGRHISLTTKDIEQAESFKKCLGINVKIGRKSNGSSKEKKYYHVQFGDILFYEFLESIGITSAKSKTIAKIKISDKYFFDFLRGCFDGDGCFYAYWDPRWRSSFMFYLEFASASLEHLLWIQETVNKRICVKGHITGRKKNIFFQLKYAKREALEIIKKMYYDEKVICLSRKRLKIEKALKINYKQQQTYS